MDAELVRGRKADEAPFDGIMCAAVVSLSIARLRQSLEILVDAFEAEHSDAALLTLLDWHLPGGALAIARPLHGGSRATGCAVTTASSTREPGTGTSLSRCIHAAASSRCDSTSIPRRVGLAGRSRGVSMGPRGPRSRPSCARACTSAGSASARRSRPRSFSFSTIGRLGDNPGLPEPRIESQRSSRCIATSVSLCASWRLSRF